MPVCCLCWAIGVPVCHKNPVAAGPAAAAGSTSAHPQHRWPAVAPPAVVFGRVVEGMGVVKKIEAMGTQSGKPRARIHIADCGQVCRLLQGHLGCSACGGCAAAHSKLTREQLLPCQSHAAHVVKVHTPLCRPVPALLLQV